MWMQALSLIYGTIAFILLAHGCHRLLMLTRLRRAEPATVAHAPVAWPQVTVQLPVYNESAVLERLLRAVLSLDYPRDRLQIQLLDDSTDVTAPLAESRPPVLRRWLCH
jgi:cellulose synthase/poly-beta-1,6-N-acetylglucosamine synthase-like glycosyltransferase